MRNREYHRIKVSMLQFNFLTKCLLLFLFSSKVAPVTKKQAAISIAGRSNVKTTPNNVIVCVPVEITNINIIVNMFKHNLFVKNIILSLILC